MNPCPLFKLLKFTPLSAPEWSFFCHAMPRRTWKDCNFCEIHQINRSKTCLHAKLEHLLRFRNALCSGGSYLAGESPACETALAVVMSSIVGDKLRMTGQHNLAQPADLFSGKAFTEEEMLLFCCSFWSGCISECMFKPLKPFFERKSRVFSESVPE